MDALVILFIVVYVIGMAGFGWLLLTPDHDDGDEGCCPNREDGTHCEHWWDGDSCCDCGE